MKIFDGQGQHQTKTGWLYDIDKLMSTEMALPLAVCLVRSQLPCCYKVKCFDIDQEDGDWLSQHSLPTHPAKAKVPPQPYMAACGLVWSQFTFKEV